MADGYISQIKLPDNSSYDIRDSGAARGNARVFYGTCSTTAGDLNKVVACSTFTETDLCTGTIVNVLFEVNEASSDSTSNLTLNIQGTGAKPIKYLYNGTYTNLPNRNYLKANQIYTFIYDGTNWIIQLMRNSNTTYYYESCYSSTAADTAAKIGIASSYTLPTNGGHFAFWLYNSNTKKSKLTLAIKNGSIDGEAKDIYLNGQVTSSDNCTWPSGFYIGYYDGTNYHFRTDGKLPGDIAGDAATVNGLTVKTAVPANAVFTDTNKYHKTGSWNGLTYTATAVNSADELKFTIPTGTSATTVAVGNHTHSTYLPKSGGTMDGTARITWADSGSWGTEGATFPNKRGGLYWTGTSDWIDLFAEETASDKLNLVINFGDDASPSLILRNRGTDKITLTPGSGAIVATSFSGSGALLTSLNASNLDSGTVPVDRLPIATSEALGIVQTGTGITNTNGVISVTAENLGLSKAMRFIGVATNSISDGNTEDPGIENYSTKTAGDVVIDSSNSREYVWSTTNKWELLGGDSSYKVTQTAVTKPTAETNKWVSAIGQDENGVINASYSSLDTSGTWSGAAKSLTYSSITIQTGSNKKASITLETLMNWLITTKKCIPSGVSCYRYLPVTWSYADNDILKLTCNGIDYELQLAGCIIEFWGNATSYNAGTFRLGIHSSPTASFTSTTDYTKFPVSSYAEYTCNGSSYTPTWRITAAATTNSAPTLSWGTTSNVGTVNGITFQVKAMDKPTYAFSDLTEHPTTLSGYGITDAMSSSKTVTNVYVSASTTDNWRKIVLSNNTYSTYSADVTAATGQLYTAKGISIQPSTGNLQTSGSLIGNGAGAINGWISYPTGGTYCQTSSMGSKVTGALKITLPSNNKSTMISFDVNIYTYDGDYQSSVVYHISGYEYSASGWHNPACRVYSEGIGEHTDLKVRFGADSDKAYITIGEINTEWKFPQIAISNILLGYSNANYSTWGSGWEITFTTTLPSASTGNRTNVNTQNINITGYSKWLMNRGGDTVTIGDSSWSHGQTGCGGTNAATVWRQNWKQSGLTYTTTSNGVTTTGNITDSGDLIIWLSQDTTGNQLWANMALDGYYYSLSGYRGGGFNVSRSEINQNITAGDNSQLLKLSNTRPAANISANQWFWGTDFLVPNTVANTNICHVFGQANSTKNSGVLNFHYAGAGSNDSYVGLGLFGAGDALKVYGNKVVALDYQLKFTNTTEMKHIEFTRTIANSGPNYICIPTNGQLAIATTTGYNNCIAVFEGSDSALTEANSLRPGKTNTYSLGTSAHIWSNIHTNDLLLHHNITFYHNTNRGTAPETTHYSSIQFYSKDNKLMGLVDHMYESNNTSRLELLTMRPTADTVQTYCGIRIYAYNSKTYGEVKVSDNTFFQVSKTDDATTSDGTTGALRVFGGASIAHSVRAESFYVENQVKLEWNETDESLDFVFA